MIPNPELIEDDNPEWTEEDFKKAMPFSDLPEELQVVLRKRGPQKAPRKVSITVRLDADVMRSFRSTGKGWQSRMNNALKQWLVEHPEHAP